jgi:hypothetical protein
MQPRRVLVRSSAPRRRPPTGHRRVRLRRLGTVHRRVRAHLGGRVGTPVRPVAAAVRPRPPAPGRWGPQRAVRLRRARQRRREAPPPPGSTIRNRRRRAVFPTGETFESWRESASSISAATQQELPTLDWIRRAENLAVVGPGTGKSHLLEALGNAATDDRLTVAWFDVESLGRLVTCHRADDRPQGRRSPPTSSSWTTSGCSPSPPRPPGHRCRLRTPLGRHVEQDPSRRVRPASSRHDRVRSGRPIHAPRPRRGHRRRLLPVHPRPRRQGGDAPALDPGGEN